MPSSDSDLQALTGEIAQIYKAHYGRGPTKLSAKLLGDALVFILEDVNSAPQAALLEAGRVDLAQAVHDGLHHAMADAMQQAVERLTDRIVRAFIPGSNAAADASTVVFLLQPLPDTT
jgi:uncharacterized protein YbcI